MIWMMFLLRFCLLMAAPVIASSHDLMPRPAKLIAGQGRLPISNDFRIGLTGYREPRIQGAAERMVRRLARQTGIPIAVHVANDAAGATLVIHCGHAGEPVQSVREDESYRLVVTPQQARLEAATPVGVLRGMGTLLQLVD